MARLKALKAGGFSLSSGFGDKQQVFRVNTLGGEVWVPDDIISKEKALVDLLLSNGDIEFVEDTDRQGPRLILVETSQLYSSATPVPLDLQGEPLQRVVFAALIEAAKTVLVLEESTDYSVVDGEVFWLGADKTSDTVALFYVE